MKVFGKKSNKSKGKAKTSKRRTTRTNAEKRAFDAGQAFEAGRTGALVSLQTKKERASFSAGVKAAKKKLNRG